MATRIDFTEQASKVNAVLTAFEEEIRRLNKENMDLQAKVASLLSALSEFAPQAPQPAKEIDNSWEVPPPIETEEITKNKRRGPNKPAAAETRCKALLPCIEMNEEGVIVPSQCKRGGESSGFCKQHSLHQSFGTTEHPNIEEFAQHQDQMVKAFNKKNGIVETKKPKRSKSAVKRSLNPYMMFLAVNRDSVKAEILQENPELKGKALAMTITSRVGRLWQSAKQGSNKVQSDDETESIDECSSGEELSTQEIRQIEARAFDWCGFPSEIETVDVEE
jgi:hypothetical protein